MMPGLRVRLAQDTDAGPIARIYNQGIEDRVATFETDLRNEEDIAGLLAERGQRYPAVVVEAGGAVVAWAGCSPYSSRPCYAGIGEFSVYVAREHRGRGAGRVAMLGLIGECRRAGLWKLVSRVFPENTASRALCRSLGFREVGTYRRHAQLDGVWRDVIIVELPLDEPAIDPPP